MPDDEWHYETGVGKQGYVCARWLRIPALTQGELYRVYLPIRKSVAHPKNFDPFIEAAPGYYLSRPMEKVFLLGPYKTLEDAKAAADMLNVMTEVDHESGPW